MISIKKYLDQDPEKKHSEPELQPEDELLCSTLESYRSALLAMGNCGAQACPALGVPLLQTLTGLGERLSKKITPRAVKETEQRVEEQLQQWGEGTAEHFKQKANEVKEILIVLARTAESVAERDQRYADQFTDLTARLHAIADLEDLTQMRASVVRSASELKTCVDKMAQDGHEAVQRLRAEVSTYQTKLEEAERAASRDNLTGLDNRRAVEAKIERRIADKRTFCVMVLDLNGFKQVNDVHGHLAGDDLLKQFAAELRSASRTTDVVGRWGGDEFMVVLDCDLPEATSHIERLQRWVFGEYTLQSSKGQQKVSMSASIGLAGHKPGESIKSLVERADAAMYEQKATARR